MSRKCIFLIVLSSTLVVIFGFVFTVVFWSPDRGLYGLGLETNFGTKLPEGGDVLYKLFAPMGRDAKEYAVIQYPEKNSIEEHFQWKAMDAYVWGEINRLLDSIDKYIDQNTEELPIPSELRPLRDMQYTMVGNYPSLADPYAFFVYSPTDGRIYVIINLT